MQEKNRQSKLKDRIIIFLEGIGSPIDEKTIAEVLEEKEQSVRSTLNDLRSRGTVLKAKSRKRTWFFRSDKPE